MRLVVPSGIVALLLLSPAAHATPSARLVYTRSGDAAGCADETALRKAVAARFGYDPFFAWARQTVIVQIWRDGGRFGARVQLVDDQGLATGTREIQSEEGDCTEVFGAAALAISIALDASAARTAPTPPAPETTAAPALPPKTEAPPPAPDRLPPVEPFAGPPAPEPAVRTRAEGPPSPVRAGFGTTAAAFIGPNVAPGLSLFGSYRRGPFSLGAELDAEVSPPASQALPESSPSSGRVASALFAVAVTPCVHSGVVFACALGKAGWLHAWGWGVDQGSSAGAPYLGVGGRVGAEVALGSRWFVRAHADLLANLERGVFELDGQGGWTVPPVGATVGLGLGAPLP